MSQIACIRHDDGSHGAYKCKDHCISDGVICLMDVTEWGASAETLSSITTSQVYIKDFVSCFVMAESEKG